MSTTALSEMNSRGMEAYRSKNVDYFSATRTDYVLALPDNPRARILEIGCGAGRTGAYALEHGKCAGYYGVELCDSAAADARKQLTEVVVGDIEIVRLPWPPEYFDALILSEVLEHLVDPWSALRKLRTHLHPGAKVFASSPNVCHYSVLRMMLQGRWDLAECGIMDKTHLRWFTPQSYRRLFESVGYAVDSVSPLAPFGFKARALNVVSLGLTKLFLTYQIDLRAHCP